MKIKRLILSVIAILLAALACNLPGNTSVDVLNQPDSAPAVEEGQLPSEEDEPATADPTDTPLPKPTMPPPVTFMGIADGDTVTAEIDPASGLPFSTFEVALRVQYSKDLPIVALDADGLHVFSRDIRYNISGDVQTVIWTPWHGNGEYVLDLWFFDKYGRPQHQETIMVTVSGIPEGTPTVQQMFIQMYKDEFGLDVPAPPFAMISSRQEFSMAEWNRSVSVVYLQERYYVLEYRMTGDLLAYSNQLYTGKGTLGVCRPEGVFFILTLIVDYPTNELNITDVTNEIKEMVAEVN